MELSDKGLRQDYTVADGGTGLRAGQALAWPDIPCRGDVFHALLDMGRLTVYLENRAFGAMSALEKTEAKMTKAKRKGCGNKYSKRLAVAGQAEAATINLADDISTLAGWLRNDILSLAGGNVDTRRQLLDFVIESLRQREHLRPHRIRPVRVMLENFFLRRQIGNGYLDLLRFFLNHRRFLRSEHPERVDKSPAELLSGKTHPHWLELLGFEMFKRAA